MESLAPLRKSHLHEESQIRLLLAGGDAGLRSLVATHAGELIDSLIVLEAVDGAEAIQIGLQRQAQLALLDVNMPRVGGIEVAMTFRELRPQMRLALQSSDLPAYRERAQACQLPLFDKLHLDHALGWLERQAQLLVEPRRLQQKSAFVCSSCGYGIARRVPPARCPMCQREESWRRPRTRRYADDWRVA
jgi:CheY-like chemotaxis protein